MVWVRENTVKTLSSRKYFVWFLAIAWWGCGLCALLFGNPGVDDLKVEIPKGLRMGEDSGPQIDHMGRMRYIRRDPAREGRCIYAVGFDELSTENARVGIFKTGACKLARVMGLELKLFRYASDDRTSSADTEMPANSTRPDIHDGINSRMVSREQVFAKVRPWVEKRTFTIPVGDDADAAAAEIKIRIDGIDLSGVAEIRVKDFDYKVFNDGNLLFAVQSRRLHASYRQPSVILRGHVTITAYDGSTLECNHAKWDVEKGHFTIDGRYLLNRSGSRSTGKGIRVDALLNEVKAEHAKSEEKEVKECFAKL